MNRARAIGVIQWCFVATLAGAGMSAVGHNGELPAIWYLYTAAWYVFFHCTAAVDRLATARDARNREGIA